MNTASAIRFHSVENPRKPFPMRQHLVYGGILATAFLAMKITDYLCGLHLNGFNLVSPMMLVVLVLFIMIPVVLIRTMQGLYRGFSGSLSAKQFAKVPLPVIAAVVVMALPIPTFNDAVAHQLRKHTSGPELVAMAGSIIESASGDQLSSLGKLPDGSPLDRLKPAVKPRVYPKANTVTLLWGGALAQGWGIAISKEPGKQPELPDEVTQTLEVYPEVTIFTLID